ncbi:azurin [Formosa agariphila KMM 3901]|uniref:Azurin n=1 Tax=Formosa agariphila (strain DSM 15362 / KCTC 12365 / LMG 23005 / KMM 3901 / M-2Alg 35-1) TaxID=1347342 RepID=T2KI02_FORAG|nr:azurin [Formosa agariphila]CDF78056.1 azurin [Formosa agariphila KMM 3901]
MKYLKLTVLMLSSTFLMNCGGKEEKKKSFSYDTEVEAPATPAVATTPETTTADTAEATDGVVEIMLHGDDKMTFNLKEIKVKAGQKVKLTLMHTGKMPKNVMGHNFVLLNKGVELSTFASKAASAADHEYVPEGSEDVIVYTKLLGGGESDVIEFDAPEAGTYDFLCSFPGHYALMKGKFIVE